MLLPFGGSIDHVVLGRKRSQEGGNLAGRVLQVVVHGHDQLVAGGPNAA